MKNNRFLQRLALHRRLAALARSGEEIADGAMMALASFGDFYQLTVRHFVQSTGAAHTLDEDGTPILDKLLDFFKWLYESGALEWLIRLFAGMAITAAMSVSAGMQVAVVDAAEQPGNASIGEAAALLLECEE